jgi:bifunctional DNA-binding transcriptional regulator/antitoxin component of YhaV-PrlF toxin-antitoxin module
VARRLTKTPDPRLVDNRNRVALSKEVLEALDLGPGDYVTFVVDEHGGVRVHKLNITVASPKRATPAGRSST